MSVFWTMKITKKKIEIIFAIYDDNSNSCDVTIKITVQVYIVWNR